MNNAMKNALVRIAAVAALVASAAAAAQTAPQRPARFEWSAGIGSFSGEDNPGRLNGQRSQYAGFGGFGWRLTPNVVLEAELPVFGQKYDTPSSLTPTPFTSVDSRAYLDTAGLAGGVKFVAPVAQRVELYAGGGLGYYRSRFQATGHVGPFDAEYNKYDSSFAPHVKAGFDVLVARGISVGLEYRKLWLSADFGNEAGGKVDIGGDFYYVTVRGRF